MSSAKKLKSIQGNLDELSFKFSNEISLDFLVENLFIKFKLVDPNEGEKAEDKLNKQQTETDSNVCELEDLIKKDCSILAEILRVENLLSKNLRDFNRASKIDLETPLKLNYKQKKLRSSRINRDLVADMAEKIDEL
jgi:hypothetical protein